MQRKQKWNGMWALVKREFTANYIMSSEDGYFRFQFFCGLCNDGHTSGRISASSANEAFRLAANEARKYFNRCCQCGKWVCDKHYNEDEMACDGCEPRARQK